MPTKPPEFTEREAEARALLPKTLELASRRPFYARHWKGRAPKRWSADTLLRLPLIDKATASEHASELIDPHAPAQTGTVSSGSTGQRLLRVHRSPEEFDAAGEYVSRHHDWTPKVSEEVASGYALEVRAMHHGIPDRPAAANRIRVPWTYTLTSLKLIRDLLENKQQGRHVTSMIIGSGALTALTAWLLEQGADPSSYHVRMIGTNGFKLTPNFRAYVEESWGAQVLDNFSLSEFMTTAMECAACGQHHWLGAPLHAEVLDPFTLKPLKKGTGLLVLTGLHPFVQAMPLIRYRTGDLVELGDVCKVAKDRGFTYRGREKWSLLDERSGVLIASQDVQDFLEGRWEVGRHPHPCEQLGLVKNNDIGAVKVDLARTGREVHLSVELRFDPMIHSEAASHFAKELGEFLLTKSEGLRNLDAKDHFAITLLRPGSLSAPWSKF